MPYARFNASYGNDDNYSGFSPAPDINYGISKQTPKKEKELLDKNRIMTSKILMLEEKIKNLEWVKGISEKTISKLEQDLSIEKNNTNYYMLGKNSMIKKYDELLIFQYDPSRNVINNIPEDVLWYLCTFLDTDSLLKLQKTCSYMNKTIVKINNRYVDDSMGLVALFRE